VFKIFANAWRVEDIRRKLLFILLLLLIFRFGSQIPLPGIDLQLLDWARSPGGIDQGTAMTLFGLITGGGLASVFAMGIAPYITASIIMQLLTYAIPKFSEMKKEGEDGQKKLQKITRYMAVVLAALQAAATVFSYTRFNNMPDLNLFREGHQNIFVYALATLAMMSGTIFIMWLAELITEKGIGQGASFLIFANILAALPMGVITLWTMMTEAPLGGTIQVLILLVVFILIIAFVVRVHEGERRIPVQYSRKGGLKDGVAPQSHLPIKVNIAGVLSIIFAMSLLQFPMQIAMFFPNAIGAEPRLLDRIIAWTDWSHPFGAVLYIVLIFMFTHFYTSFAVNPREMAENLKKNGGFIAGIRPGEETTKFIQKTVNRLAWIGAIFYSIIAITPILLDIGISFFTETDMQLGFGGTSLLIVTGVALEFVKQLESQLVMRHYKGFLS